MVPTYLTILGRQLDQQPIVTYYFTYYRTGKARLMGGGCGCDSCARP